ncbi:MAG: PaaI family thioesterase [Actinomycetota bacterium]
MTSDELTDMLHAMMPLTATLGLRAVSSSPGQVVVELDWSEALCTSGGVLHGGTLMAVADSVGAACAVGNLPAGATGTATIESKTNFLGAVTDGTVRAVATPLHVGGRTIVVETELRVGERLVAKTTQTQAVFRPT